MNWWQRVWNRWRLEDQLDAELRFHFDRLVRDYIDEGATGREARRRARAEFGGVEEIKDACRDARGTRWVHDIAQDVRFSARLLLKERSVTLVAVLALSLGIGVNNAMFTLVEAMCIRGLPIVRADRVADVAQRDQAHPDLLLSPRQFDELQTSAPAPFAGISGYTSRTATLTDDRNAATRILVAYVSADALRTIAERPSFGRDFETADGRQGAAPVAILSAALWRGRYDADPAAMGSFIRVNGVSTAVVGVMPDGFRFPDDADVWEPLEHLAPPADARVLHVYGRLADGATMAQAQDGVAAVLSRVPSPSGAIAGLRTVVAPINTRYVGDITNPAWRAFIIVGLLLVVIACSNVANVLLARGVNRRREVALRLSLGATRGRIVRQLLIESLMLACLGGIGAITVSAIGLRVVEAATPPGGLGYWVTLTMDARIAATLAAVCLGTAVLFGLVPAWQLARTDALTVTKNSSSSVTQDRSTGRLTWGFLTCQLALAVILVSQLLFEVQGSYDLRKQGPSIDAKHILTFGLVLPQASYATRDQRSAFYRVLADRLTGRGAASVSVASALPLQPGVHRRIVPVDEALTPTTPSVSSFDVDDAYFRTLGLDLVAGRPFMRETTDDQTAIVVNERFADLYFHGMNAVGRRVRLELPAGAHAGSEVRTIVGVAPSVHAQLAIEPPPLVFLPLESADAPNAAILVRGTPETASSLGRAIRDEVRTLDRNVPITNLMTLEDAEWKARWLTRTSTGILTTVAIVAFSLSTIGLMGLTAYGVGRRRREFGIRLALGAAPLHVVVLTLRRVLLQVLVGAAFGSLLAIGWEHVFGAAVRTTPTLIVENLVGTSLLLTAFMLAAAAWPARRAGQIDPLLTLKAE